ncbi:BON domain-containing protein [Nodularia harveyana UHCC-0300]|uniref:BON domain-containing protein n=1 Tax=Nodularia harveyana UHCC-0300 TaxID=2974287 RepID=A0ABU5UDF8_9CYAN|nr:BON domain-containing protein [Nodularia harveyana]MEA5581145.1 BON domain-containing protein [Nodularia harveyana UHCC-0300]
MQKLTPFLISCVLLLGATACTDNVAKTDFAAPSPGEVVEAPTSEERQESLEESQGETRRRQLDADIRAREERTAALNDGLRNPEDVASEVRSKLEANIPGGLLTIEATKEGLVTVSGSVSNKDQLSKIEPLAKEIDGVNNVVVDAVVVQPRG